MIDQPIAVASVGLNVASLVWSLANRQWGMAIYWLAAAMITTSATWFRHWHG